MSEQVNNSSRFDNGLIELHQRISSANPLLGLVALLVAVSLVATLLIGDRFLSAGNLRSMAIQIPEFGLLSIAMMTTLLKGGLNLSIVATANACALVVGGILVTFAPGTDGALLHLLTVGALFAGVAVAIVIGLAIGVLVAYIGISSIIATLGMMILLQGLAVGFTRGGVISGFPEPIAVIGQGEILYLPVSLIIFIAAAGILAFVLNRTAFGASLYMIGTNEAATRYSGVNTRLVMVQCYVTSSLFAFLAGIVMMGRFNSANAAYGESYLLITILAAVLGGINPFGGFGKVGGLVLSLVILQVIQSAFNQLSVSPYLTLAIWGGLLICVAAVTSWLDKSRR